MSETVAPLLNGYKYPLLFSRLFQTVSGGMQVKRGLPCYHHVIQSLLWLLPFLLSLPLIGVSFTQWNGLYLGILYSVLLSIVSFIITITQFYIKRNQSSDEETDHCYTLSRVVSYIFASKTPPNLIIHPVMSGLTGFTGFVLLNVQELREIIPLPGLLILILITGWVSVCFSHYSLLVSPSIPFINYRTEETPPTILQLKFVNYSFYIISFGLGFILMRYIFNVQLVFLRALYACFSFLSFLWVLGLLSSFDSLFLYCIEQCLIIFMGGSGTSSEIRLILLFVVSLISVVITSLLCVYYSATACVVLSGVLGFLLSLNILQFFIDTLRYCCLQHIRSISSSRHYSLFILLLMKDIHFKLKNYMIKYSLDFFRALLLLLTVSLVLYYTVSTTNDDNDEVSNSTVTELYTSTGIIVLWVMEVAVKLISSLYCCNMCYYTGGLRNPLHSRDKDSINQFMKKRRQLFYCTGTTRQFLIHYVYPLCMVVYIGLNIRSGDGDISSVWFAVTTLRLLRKVWQDTVHTLHELCVVAILSLSANGWSIGTTALITGYCLTVLWNFIYNLQFYLVLLHGLILDSKQRTRKHCLSLFFTFILLPISFLSLVTSSLLSSPILPIFTLPILLPVSPRPSFYWPQHIHRSFNSTSNDRVYYQQAVAGIMDALHVTGILSGGGAGEVWMFRFQDRTGLVKLLETGYGYQSLSLLGLELQETSCHTVEVAAIDESLDLAYTTNKSSVYYYFNSFVFSVFTPVDSYVAKVYSDAHNSLTGIIDQPTYLSKFNDNFFKTLLYIMIQFSVVDTSILPDHVLVGSSTAGTNTAGANTTAGATSAAGATSTAGAVSSVHVSGLLISEGSQQSLDIEYLRQAFLSPSTAIRGGGGDHVRRSADGVRFTRHNRIQPLTNTSSLPSSIPLPNDTIASIISNTFPQEWFNYLLDTLEVRGLLTPTQLMNIKTLAAVTHRIITDSSTPTPQYLYRGYTGLSFTQTDQIQWLTTNSILYSITLKAFRYAVKLLYDEGAIGEASNDDELYTDYLLSYATSWYIGLEDDAEWGDAVLSHKPHLFSMDYDQETCSYSSHVLSLQDEVIHILHLNPFALKGVWSNLLWELLYLTNDDEERYSIQAHRRLLRNMLSQMAAVPLGYYIYQSDIITVSY